MSTLHCVRDSHGNVEISTAASLNSVSMKSMRTMKRQLGTMRPRPLNYGLERDADQGKTRCVVTLHGHTSNDGIMSAIKAIGLTLAPVMIIDDIDVTGMAH